MGPPTLFELCAQTVIDSLKEELALQDPTLVDWYWSIPPLILETYIDPRLSAHDTRLWDLLYRPNNNRIVTEQELQRAEEETREDDYNCDEDYYEDYRTSRYYDSDDEAAEWLEAELEADLPDWF